MKGKREEMNVELIDKKIADVLADYEIIFIVDKNLSHRFVDDLGEFDFYRLKYFTNNGDIDVGMEIEIIAFDTVTNPVLTDVYGEFFGVGHGTGSKKVTMQAGDIIRINTNKGKKSVVLNGTTNLLDKVKPQSTWLILRSGDNQFSIASDDESKTNMSFNLVFNQRYI